MPNASTESHLRNTAQKLVQYINMAPHLFKQLLNTTTNALTKITTLLERNSVIQQPTLSTDTTISNKCTSEGETKTKTIPIAMSDKTPTSKDDNKTTAIIKCVNASDTNTSKQKPFEQQQFQKLLKTKDKLTLNPDIKTSKTKLCVANY